MSELVVPSTGLAEPSADRRLTAIEFHGLVDVPSELEWFANVDNKSTRRAYETHCRDASALLLPTCARVRMPFKDAAS